MKYFMESTGRSLCVRQAELDDWIHIKTLQKEVQGSRAERFIYAGDAELEAAFLHSNVNPVNVALLGLWDESVLRGMVSLFLQIQPQMHILGAPNMVNAFIQSVYVSPSARPIAGFFLLKAIEDWARQRKAPLIAGNIYPREGRVNAFVKKYGFEPYHTVIGRKVDLDG